MTRIRITTDKVSFSNKNNSQRPSAPLTFLQYNGAPEEHEDPADYFTQDIAINSLKGVRIA